MGGGFRYSDASGTSLTPQIVYHRKNPARGNPEGDCHEFEVTIDDPEHPVTADFTEFELGDQLYHGLAHSQDIENETFQRLLIRGCEWAATGSVAVDT